MSSMGSIDVNSIVTQLMQVEHQPVDLLTSRKAAVQKTADAYDSLKKLLDDITSKGNALDTASEWNLLKASSSSTSVTTAITSGGFSGSLSFTVTDVATAQKLYSTSTFTSTAAKVTTASRQLLSAGATALGFSSLKGSSDLSVGSHTVEVTQASTKAVKTGPWPQSKVTIDPATNDLKVVLNGTEYTVNIPAGTDLDHQSVVDNLNTAFGNAGIGGQITASLTSTGDLQLATTGEGSANSLQITGGGALGALGLTVDATAIKGTDGKVKVDGVEQTITDVRAGRTVSLAAGTGPGTIDLTMSGGLRTGKITARNVDYGDGSLASVVSAINGSGGDVTATAIKVGDNAYRLQIQSKVSGVAGRFNFDTSAFDGVGGFATLSAGSDATIQLTGDNPITLTSSSNTFSDVLPGVAFTVSAKTTDAVTITATQDQDTLTSKVSALIDSVNKALSDIKTKTAYDPSTKSAGTLMGESTVSRLRDALVSAVTGAVAGGDLKTASQVGISINRDGTLALDKTKFANAVTANPQAVQRLFVAPTGETDKTKLGIADRLDKALDAATNFSKGYVTLASAGRKSTIADINKQIDSWEDRLTRKKDALTSQFSALNTALSSLGQQSQWISGQLAGLG